jgi:hypothetical protein
MQAANFRLESRHAILEFADFRDQVLSFLGGGFEPVEFGRRLPHRDLQVLGLPRLFYELENMPLVDRGDDGFQIGVAREKHPDRLVMPRLEFRQHLDARDLGHPLVRHHDVHFLFLHDPVAVNGAIRLEDPKLAAQEVVHRVAHVGLVVDDQKAVP